MNICGHTQQMTSCSCWSAMRSLRIKLSNILVKNYIMNTVVWFQMGWCFSDSNNECACCLFFGLPPEELSDEYQTDYDEDAVESALSDFEAFTAGSEHTEGEETADTAETVCTKPILVSHLFTIKINKSRVCKGSSTLTLFLLPQT